MLESLIILGFLKIGKSILEAGAEAAEQKRHYNANCGYGEKAQEEKRYEQEKRRIIQEYGTSNWWRSI